MKIGIITFHKAINYGAILQCYALQSFLKDAGYDVQILNYESPYIKSVYKVCNCSFTCTC